MNIRTPGGLTYKTFISQEARKLLEQGALVHMFEFRTDDVAARGKTSDNDSDKFMNFTNGLLGKSTGYYSEYRMGKGMHRFFDEENNVFRALPCSGIRTGFPMQLFSERANVGVLIDPAQVQFMVVQTQDCYSQIVDLDRFRVRHGNIFNDKILDDANFKDATLAKAYAVMSMDSGEEKHKELSKLFNGHLWDIFSGGHQPGEPGFTEQITRSIEKYISEMPNEVPMMMEILANVPPEAIKGVVAYTSKNYKLGYNKSQFGISEGFFFEGIMLANLVREKVKQGTGIDLPVLHYHSNLNIDKQNKKIEFTAPSIREINIENKKVVDSLVEKPQLKNIYEYYLGKEHVQKMEKAARDSFFAL